MELTGRIIAVMAAQSGVSARTGNSWMSQDYVIEVPGQYPKRCVFRIFGEDRIKQFNIQMNEDVTIQFDIDAHEYQVQCHPCLQGDPWSAARCRCRCCTRRSACRFSFPATA